MWSTASCYCFASSAQVGPRHEQQHVAGDHLLGSRVGRVDRLRLGDHLARQRLLVRTAVGAHVRQPVVVAIIAQDRGLQRIELEDSLPEPVREVVDGALAPGVDKTAPPRWSSDGRQKCSGSRRGPQSRRGPPAAPVRSPPAGRTGMPMAVDPVRQRRKVVACRKRSPCRWSYATSATSSGRRGSQDRSLPRFQRLVAPGQPASLRGGLLLPFPPFAPRVPLQGVARYGSRSSTSSRARVRERGGDPHVLQLPRARSTGPAAASRPASRGRSCASGSRRRRSRRCAGA